MAIDNIKRTKGHTCQNLPIKKINILKEEKQKEATLQTECIADSLFTNAEVDGTALKQAFVLVKEPFALTT